VLEGDALVVDAPLLLTDADGGDDVARAVQGFVGAGGRGDAHRAALAPADMAAEGAQQRQFFGVDVHQAQLVQADAARPAQGGSRQEWRAHSGAADHGQFHRVLLPSLRRVAGEVAIAIVAGTGKLRRKHRRKRLRDCSNSLPAGQRARPRLPGPAASGGRAQRPGTGV